MQLPRERSVRISLPTINLASVAERVAEKASTWSLVGQQDSPGWQCWVLSPLMPRWVETKRVKKNRGVISIRLTFDNVIFR